MQRWRRSCGARSQSCVPAQMKGVVQENIEPGGLERWRGSQQARLGCKGGEYCPRPRNGRPGRKIFQITKDREKAKCVRLQNSKTQLAREESQVTGLGGHEQEAIGIQMSWKRHRRRTSEKPTIRRRREVPCLEGATKNGMPNCKGVRPGQSDFIAPRPSLLFLSSKPLWPHSGGPQTTSLPR